MDNPEKQPMLYTYNYGYIYHKSLDCAYKCFYWIFNFNLFLFRS